MSDRPSLSVVLLNYNHGIFIAEAFTALAAGLRSEDEMIVIDDASSDDSLAILHQLHSLFPTAQIVARKKNKGVIAGMNDGLRMASRTYIYFAAADDRVAPNLFDKSLHLLGEHPYAGISTARSWIIDQNGKNLGLMPTPVVSPKPRYLPPAEVAAAFRRDDNWLVGCSTIYQRDRLAQLGGFRPELGSFCDGFASRLMAFEHGACFNPDGLSYWRRMEEGYSQTETANSERVMRIGETAAGLFNGPYARIVPPAYARRWRKRWFFGAEAYRLRAWRTRLEKRIAESHKARARYVLQMMVKMIWAARLIATFVIWRPFDLVPSLLRRLSYLRGATPGK